MEIIKNYTDFIDKRDVLFKECLKNRFSSDVVGIKIKNREYMLKYLEPKHDFLIYTTALPCAVPA